MLDYFADIVISQITSSKVFEFGGDKYKYHTFIVN